MAKAKKSEATKSEAGVTTAREAQRVFHSSWEKNGEASDGKMQAWTCQLTYADPSELRLALDVRDSQRLVMALVSTAQSFNGHSTQTHKAVARQFQHIANQIDALLGQNADISVTVIQTRDLERIEKLAAQSAATNSQPTENHQ